MGRLKPAVSASVIFQSAMMMQGKPLARTYEAMPLIAPMFGPARPAPTAKYIATKMTSMPIVRTVTAVHCARS
eukprot:3998349-Pyramimonas_sp.AAC.1